MQNHICLVMCIPTWNRLMSLGFPAFFKQFWLHLRKNFRKNLQKKDRNTFKRLKLNENTQGQQHSYVNSRQLVI